MFPAELAYEMATLGGARTMQLEDQIGSLEPGKRADLVLHDTDRPEWRPLLNVVNQLVWSADGRGVHTVVVDGRVVVEDFRCTIVDEDRAVGRRPAARRGDHRPQRPPRQGQVAGVVSRADGGLGRAPGQMLSSTTKVPGPSELLGAGRAAARGAEPQRLQVVGSGRGLGLRPARLGDERRPRARTGDPIGHERVGDLEGHDGGLRQRTELPVRDERRVGTDGVQVVLELDHRRPVGTKGQRGLIGWPADEPLHHRRFGARRRDTGARSSRPGGASLHPSRGGLVARPRLQHGDAARPGRRRADPATSSDRALVDVLCTVGAACTHDTTVDAVVSRQTWMQPTRSFRDETLPDRATSCAAGVIGEASSSRADRVHDDRSYVSLLARGEREGR